MNSLLPSNRSAAMTSVFRCVAALVLPLSFVGACTNTSPHPDPATHSSAPIASSSAPITSTSTADAQAPLDASVVEDASTSLDEANHDAATGDASSSAEPKSARPFVKDNKVLPPLESEELTLRARQLFDAIVKDEPALGESFWFPKEPFIPLKDVKGPDKYWDNLHATFVQDIHKLHRKRKSWEGAQFVSFKVGSKPKWVPPGDEANKIGYYRSFRGKLTYRLDDKISTLDVHTIISWQGEWFITHLSKFKKK